MSHALGKKHEKGVVLIMATIIMSTIAVVAVEFALRTAYGIRQGAITDNSQRAYYAAESGIESALYQVRKEGVTTSLARTAPAVGSGVTWSLVDRSPSDKGFSSASPVAHYTALGVDQTVEIRAYGGEGGDSTAIDSLKVQWASHTCKDPAHPEPWIEISTVDWEATAGTVNWQTSEVKRFFKQGTTGPGGGYTLIESGIEKNRATIMRVKSYYCTLYGAQITLHESNDGSGSAAQIPNMYMIAPVGTVGSGTSQVVQKGYAQMPRDAQASGLYDYVIFSEEQLAK